MEALVLRHQAARRFRAAEVEADEILARALAIADDVRRSARGGDLERPSATDCARLEAEVSRVDRLARSAEASPTAGELQAAVARGDVEQAADLACQLFSGLERDSDPADHGYVALTLRRRASRRGARAKGEPDRARETGAETLIHPERLAAEIQAAIQSGDLGRPAAPSESATAPVIPDPLVLSPSLESSGSEVAIRVPVRDAAGAAPFLRHVPSGDLWVFAARLAGPFTVAAAREPEDEWWAASPLPYASYLEGLREALRRSDIPLEIGG